LEGVFFASVSFSPLEKEMKSRPGQGPAAVERNSKRSNYEEPKSGLATTRCLQCSRAKPQPDQAPAKNPGRGPAAVERNSNRSNHEEPKPSRATTRCLHRYKSKTANKPKRERKTLENKAENLNSANEKP
jgi:hypothetical protein